MRSLLSAVKSKETKSPAGNGFTDTKGEALAQAEKALSVVLPPEEIAQLILENRGAAQSEIEQALDDILAKPPFSFWETELVLKLRDAILARYLGLGPIDSLLNDEEVSEIMVNGPGSIFFERQGKLFKSDKVFSSEAELRQLIDHIIAPLGRRLDESTPLVNARLKEGHRVHAIIPPLSLIGPVLTVRKFRKTTYSLEELVSLQFLPSELAEVLRACVKARKNIAVSGGTGTGKTTFLNTLSQEISLRERIITIEDSAELQFHTHPHVVRLESRAANLEGKGEITLRDLVINSLRMRPDRIIVGEVRGGEALEMLQAMNTGHDGSMTTLHANSENEVAGRLLAMVGYSAQLTPAQVLSQIGSAFDVIVQLSRRRDGLRRIISASFVSGSTGEGLNLHQFYSLSSSKDQKTQKLIDTPHFCGSAAFFDELVSEGLLAPEAISSWR